MKETGEIKDNILDIRKGDKFIVNGEIHTASTSAHVCTDSSYSGWIVYDEDGEGWFEEDFDGEVTYNLCFLCGGGRKYFNLRVPGNKTKEEVVSKIYYYIELNENSGEKYSPSDVLTDMVCETPGCDFKRMDYPTGNAITFDIRNDGGEEAKLTTDAADDRVSYSVVFAGMGNRIYYNLCVPAHVPSYEIMRGVGRWVEHYRDNGGIIPSEVLDSVVKEMPGWEYNRCKIPSYGAITFDMESRKSADRKIWGTDKDDKALSNEELIEEVTSWSDIFLNAGSSCTERTMRAQKQIIDMLLNI